LKPSGAPTPFSFRLSFRNQGCLQHVATEELWVCAVVQPDKDGLSRWTIVQTIDDLERDIAETVARLRDLDAAAKVAPLTQVDAKRRRDLARKLDVARGRLAELRSFDSEA
jgi:hypothetical protein